MTNRDRKRRFSAWTRCNSAPRCAICSSRSASDPTPSPDEPASAASRAPTEASGGAGSSSQLDPKRSSMTRNAAASGHTSPRRPVASSARFRARPRTATVGARSEWLTPTSPWVSSSRRTRLRARRRSWSAQNATRAAKEVSSRGCSTKRMRGSAHTASATTSWSDRRATPCRINSVVGRVVTSQRSSAAMSSVVPTSSSRGIRTLTTTLGTDRTRWDPSPRVVRAGTRSANSSLRRSFAAAARAGSLKKRSGGCHPYP